MEPDPFVKTAFSVLDSLATMVVVLLALVVILVIAVIYLITQL
jgi:hypothetical protein